MSTKAMTMAPIEVGDNSDTTPEFVRTSDLRRMFGLARGTVYNLHRDGKIRGVLLRVKGRKSGVRLWDVSSVRAFIRDSMETQTLAA